DDLRACRKMMRDVEDFSDAIFGFHVQQAIEKGFKAWLSALGVAYPKTHELHRLLMLLEEHGAPTEECHWVEEFNPFAVQFRYESSPWDESLDRGYAVSMTEVLLDHVGRQIEGIASR
ncbi:MAG: HEPN domain-containing protein, partial [Magnetococcales bacterium]|nr:HEPN domain-containing protein [Magnetococcales bacterium]